MKVVQDELTEASKEHILFGFTGLSNSIGIIFEEQCEATGMFQGVEM